MHTPDQDVATYTVDLHVHSTCSDGVLTPEELVALAKKRGVRAMALTDHDTARGVKRAQAAGLEHDVEVVAGIEISAELEREVHIVGLFIDPECPRLLRVEANLEKLRRDRIVAILAKLQELGIELDQDEIFASAHGNLGRPHIARALCEHGFCQNIDDAFHKYLGVGAPSYYPSAHLGTMEAIDLIHEAHGLAFLAHPGIDNAAALLSRLIGQGIDGIECVHPSHNARTVRTLKRTAERNNLLTSGGSDFHTPVGHVLIGNSGVSYEHFETLVRRSQNRHQESK